MRCVNCSIEVTSRYCPECGQPTIVKRISAVQMWYDFQGRIYGFDGMFPRTLKDLTLRPGETARSFISGTRVRYYGPVGYFFLMITLLILLAEILGVDLATFMNRQAGADFEGDYARQQQQMSGIVVGFVVNYMKLVMFLLVPMQAFVSKYLFFRKSGYNYLEHTILPFYVMGHLYWITIANLLTYRFFGWMMPKFPILLISCLFFGYAYLNFIDYQSRVKAFLKGISIYLTAMLIFVLLAIIIMITLVVVSPEFRQLVAPVNSR